MELEEEEEEEGPENVDLNLKLFMKIRENWMKEEDLAIKDVKKNQNQHLLMEIRESRMKGGDSRRREIIPPNLLQLRYWM